MITAQQALRWLEEGNTRFAEGRPEGPRRELDYLCRIPREKQSPIATIVSCADSRCALELLFDLGFGELYTIRTAGNVIAVNETGTVEYGVSVVQTPLVVVLGHSHCAAITAAVRGDAAQGCITEIMDLLHPPVRQVLSEHAGAGEAEMVAYAVEANVWHGMERLFRGSQIISRQVRDKRLMLIGAIFDLATGRVNWLGPHPQEAGLMLL